jgi:hypothetical protein
MKVAAYPGKLSEEGFEADAEGRPVPVATLTHGYQMVTYDTHRQRFMGMPWDGGGYSHAVIRGRREFLKANAGKQNNSRASPWMYDTVAGRWERHATKERSPSGGCGGFVYLPAHRKAFYYVAGLGVWFYDPAANAWTAVKPGGPMPPFAIDFVACHDPKRDRVYLGGGDCPVAAGDNALWIFDVKTNAWVDPKPEGKPGAGCNKYTNARAVMDYDSASDVVVVFRHLGTASEKGVHVYHPDANKWTTAFEGLPKDWPSGAINGFYDSKLNACFFHVAGDSVDNGVMWAYRYRRAAGKK